MKKLAWLGLFLCIGGICFAQDEESRKAPAELMKEKNALEGYGREEYRLVNEKDEVISVLRNGMTVITKRVASPVTSVRGYVMTGGVYEGKWLGGGLSHLLEHLVAGGSSQRRSEANNRNLLQQIGNNSNAYTSEDHTAYFINTTKDHMEQAVDLLTGWLLGALITPEEYRREYQVVQRELEKGKGEPDRQFAYMSQMNRYQVSPARVPVIGYQEVIQGLSRDDVYNYYKMAYQPQNMILAVAGDLDPEAMLRAVQKYVEDAKPGRVFEHNLTAEPPVLAPRTLVATFPKIGQAKLELAFPSVRLSNQDMYALDLLSSALGAGESSVLVEEIRDKRQLVRAIMSGDETPSYVEGSFVIYMQLDAKKIDQATKAVLDLIEKVKTDGIDEDRLTSAKTQIKVGHVRGLETTEGVASSLATDYMQTGDPHFSDRYVDRIARVTNEQIKDVAKRYLVKERLVTTVMLPAEAVGSEGLTKAEDLIRPVAPTTQAGEIATKSEVKRLELSNGTIVLLKRMTAAPVVNINMYALGGLTLEDEKSNGIGNLTMEMLMRGTKTRSAQQIAEFFDSIGAEMNTACGNNSWYWTGSCLKENFAKVLEVYADVVNNPSFPETELSQMKQRVEAAIDGQDADWHSQAFRFFKKTYFGPKGEPYQFTVHGTKPNVEAITPAAMKEWYDQKVMPARRVLAIYGDINVDQAAKLAEDYLGKGEKLAGKAPENVAPAVNPPTETKPSVDVQRVEVQQTEQKLAGIVIGFNAETVVGDPSNSPIMVGQTMCSGYGYPTGYFFEILRGRGLVYEVAAMNQPGQSAKMPGAFIAYAGCEPSKVNEVVETMIENIARLQGSEQDVQLDWYERAKKLLMTNEALENETPGQQASINALDELFGMGYQFHDHFEERIKAVTLDQIRDLARTRLSSCVVTISTPMPDKVSVKKGLRTYESFPPVDLTPRGIQHDTGGKQ